MPLVGIRTGYPFVGIRQPREGIRAVTGDLHSNGNMYGENPYDIPVETHGRASNVQPQSTQFRRAFDAH